MIPSDQAEIDKLKALAERNIANGDWGDEVTLPGETAPMSPEERIIKLAGNKKLPPKQ